MARKGLTVTTTVSFQVTFVLPAGVTIPTAREIVREVIQTKIPADQVKIHLTNKEVSYGKR
jgi:hypothetical protein